MTAPESIIKKIPWSRFIRRTHMYLALFLTPWMFVYALSSTIFNHFRFFSGGKPLAQFEQVEELPYEAVFSDGIELHEGVVVAILSSMVMFAM